MISSLFVGIALDGVISGKLNIIQEFLIPSIGTQGFVLILLVYLSSLGGLIGVWTRIGGAEWAGGKIVRGPKTAKFFTWMMGLIIHQGGTISTVFTGATVWPITDKNGVSHGELSYMANFTASPAAMLIPFNLWPLYIAGLVGTIPLFLYRPGWHQLFLGHCRLFFTEFLCCLLLLYLLGNYCLRYRGKDA